MDNTHWDIEEKIIIFLQKTVSTFHNGLTANMKIIFCRSPHKKTAAIMTNITAAAYEDSYMY